MTPRIQSIEQLRIEKSRLMLEKSHIESRLKTHFKVVSDSIKPANLIKSAFGSIANDSEVMGTIKTKGAEAAIGLLMSQMLLKNSNPVIRAVVGVMGTTLASTIFGDQASRYVEKFKSIFHRYMAKRKDKSDADFDQEDIYTS